MREIGRKESVGKRGKEKERVCLGGGEKRVCEREPIQN